MSAVSLPAVSGFHSRSRSVAAVRTGAATSEADRARRPEWLGAVRGPRCRFPSAGSLLDLPSPLELTAGSRRPLEVDPDQTFANRAHCGRWRPWSGGAGSALSVGLDPSGEKLARILGLMLAVVVANTQVTAVSAIQVRLPGSAQLQGQIYDAATTPSPLPGVPYLTCESSSSVKGSCVGNDATISSSMATAVAPASRLSRPAQCEVGSFPQVSRATHRMARCLADKESSELLGGTHVVAVTSPNQQYDHLGVAIRTRDADESWRLLGLHAPQHADLWQDGGADACADPSGHRAPALPGALRPQPSRARAQVPRRHGRRGVPHLFAQPTPPPSPGPGTRSATSSPAGSPKSAH